MFKLGQEVVCVDDSSLPAHVPKIKKNQIYTIDRLIPCKCGFLAISIEGIKAPPYRQYMCNCGQKYFNYQGIQTYKASRFRPLDDVLDAIELTEVEEILEDVCV